MKLFKRKIKSKIAWLIILLMICWVFGGSIVFFIYSFPTSYDLQVKTPYKIHSKYNTRETGGSQGGTTGGAKTKRGGGPQTDPCDTAHPTTSSGDLCLQVYVK